MWGRVDPLETQKVTTLRKRFKQKRLWVETTPTPEPVRGCKPPKPQTTQPTHQRPKTIEEKRKVFQGASTKAHTRGSNPHTTNKEKKDWKRPEGPNKGKKRWAERGTTGQSGNTTVQKNWGRGKKRRAKQETRFGGFLLGEAVNKLRGRESLSLRGGERTNESSKKKTFGYKRQKKKKSTAKTGRGGKKKERGVLSFG